MRNMSFWLTQQQILQRAKSVTRRIGSRTAKVGEYRQPIQKGQGLKKGQKVQRLGGPIRFIDVRFERLGVLITYPIYGRAECIKEGFPHLTPREFVEMFCRHNGCTPDTHVTRIEFEYVD
jgi:hypothetical protein